MPEPVVRQGFEPNGRNPFRHVGERKLVEIAFGSITAGKNRIIRLNGQERHVRFGARWAHRLPGHSARLFAFKPKLEGMFHGFLAAGGERSVLRHGRAQAQAEAAHGVLAPEILIQTNRDTAAGRRAERFGKFKRGRLWRIERLASRVHRPACFGLTVEGCSDRKFILLHIRHSSRNATGSPGPAPVTGEFVTLISVSTKFPCAVRPGPLLGSESSVRASNRRCVMPAWVVLKVTVT